VFSDDCAGQSAILDALSNYALFRFA